MSRGSLGGCAYQLVRHVFAPTIQGFPRRTYVRIQCLSLSSPSVVSYSPGWLYLDICQRGRSDAWRLDDDAVAPVGLNSHLFAGMLLTCFYKQMLTGNAPYHFERRLEQRNPPLQHLVLVMDRGDSHGAALELEVHGPITELHICLLIHQPIIMKNNKQTNKIVSQLS